jgi:hypothetical protein
MLLISCAEKQDDSPLNACEPYKGIRANYYQNDGEVFEAVIIMQSDCTGQYIDDEGSSFHFKYVPPSSENPITDMTEGLTVISHAKGNAESGDYGCVFNLPDYPEDTNILYLACAGFSGYFYKEQ